MTNDDQWIDELREQLAAIEHERWADWQKYMHSLCNKLGDFDTDYALVIPSKSVAHWERQIKTPYSQLSDKEKASDMEQVDRYWPLIKAKMLEARLDEIRLSNLTSAIDRVRAKYMQNRVAELQALSTKEAQND